MKGKLVIKVNDSITGELHPDAIVGGCIDIFENAWFNPLETIQMIEIETLNPDSEMSWTIATTVGQEIDESYQLEITSTLEESGNTVMKNVYNQMHLILLASTIPYAQKHGIEKMHHEPYNILKCRGRQHYGAYPDREAATGRSISAIVYLNDDYNGGEIEFINFGIKIKPEPGMLMLFPSNYAYNYITHPVTDGIKYSVVAYIQGRQLNLQ